MGYTFDTLSTDGDLICENRRLLDEFTLSYYHIRQEDTIWLISRLRGGGYTICAIAIAVALFDWDGDMKVCISLSL